MPSIKKSVLPEGSSLHNEDYDYIDSFEGMIIDTNHTLTVGDIGKAFFTSAPAWVGILFALRNRIAGLIGLKTPSKKKDTEEMLRHFHCEPGERLGLFKVLSKSEQEVVLGEDDTHLNFRVSLWIQPSPGTPVKHLIVSTSVKFNNRMGRMYFAPVRPFHRLIVPVMLKGMIRQLSK